MQHVHARTRSALQVGTLPAGNCFFASSLMRLYSTSLSATIHELVSLDRCQQTVVVCVTVVVDLQYLHLWLAFLYMVATVKVWSSSAMTLRLGHL